MSANAKETIADIVAEIRKVNCFSVPYVPSGHNGVWSADLLEFVDRIEAAWKRETQTYLDQIRDAMNQFGHEKFKAEHAPVGNAAAMREALEEVRFYLPYFLQYMRLNREDAESGGYYERILEVVNAALAKPPRNCDLFSIYSEAEDYWHENVECAEVNGCFDVWLFEPAAERKGECDER